MLFILVWRAILGSSDLLLSRSWRTEAKFALSPRPVPKDLRHPCPAKVGGWVSLGSSQKAEVQTVTVFLVFPEFGSECGLL